MISWHSPWAFFAFILVALVIFWIFYSRRQRRPSIQFSGLSVFQGIRPTWRSRLSILPLILKFIALGLAIVALARPQRADTQIKRNVEGVDIMVAMDISDSMLIEDMRPENRLEAAKVVISDFVAGRVSDRIGLVLFAGESFTKVPLTLDYPLLQQSIKEIQPSRNIKMGTALGVALANAVARLKDSTAKSRIVIFLTDGENNSGTIDPETALEIAKGYKVKIYSIGMGRDGQAQLPVIVQDASGRQMKQYRPISSQINEELLGRMASETGGLFYRATTGQALDKVFKEIDRLEKTKIEVNELTKYAELFPPYVQWALMLYFLAALLGRSILRRGP